jgi:hypothetical protein
LYISLWTEPPGYSNFTLNAAELKRQDRVLEEQFQACNHFKAIQHEIFRRLSQGQLSLSQACDELYQRAREEYPPFLRFLRDPNCPLKEKLARNVIDYFRMQTRATPSSKEVALRLERERKAPSFCAWCRQPW